MYVYVCNLPIHPHCVLRYLTNFDSMKFKWMQCNENCEDLQTKLELAEDLHRHLDLRLSEIKPELIQLERERVEYTGSVRVGSLCVTYLRQLC